jgi:hypothetical protein
MKKYSVNSCTRKWVCVITEAKHQMGGNVREKLYSIWSVRILKRNSNFNFNSVQSFELKVLIVLCLLEFSNPPFALTIVLLHNNNNQAF